ncbi:MAG: hypothetical protein WA664_01640 [Candidatus Acidiferrales bacterium]
MIESLSDYYRIPDDSLGRVIAPEFSNDAGFFRFGPEAICYGQSASGVSKRIENAGLFDAAKDVQIDRFGLHLPFDPAQIIDNLRRERYIEYLVPGRERFVTQQWLLKAYYFIRALLPVGIRRHLQRAYFSDWRKRPFPAWPVDFTVDTLHEEFLRLSMQAAGVQRMPFIWFWPEGAPSCLIMTHDVETRAGRDSTPQLMDLDESYGIKASFQVIPEDRYEVTDEYVRGIRRRGFEFNIHDLNHDGHLYQKREEFLRRAKKINEYGRLYDAQGFRAGAMYRMLDWYDSFKFSYDMSLTNVAHLEPKRGGCCTVFPFFIGKILELPLTTSQDYSIIHILNEHSIELWKQQIELILRRNGLISFIVHPDYSISGRSRRVYETLLAYLRQMIARENIWATLPGEVDKWWRARREMRLVRNGESWLIKGPQSERARLAFALIEGDRLVYEVAGSHEQEAVRP